MAEPQLLKEVTMIREEVSEIAKPSLTARIVKGGLVGAVLGIMWIVLKKL